MKYLIAILVFSTLLLTACDDSIIITGTNNNVVTNDYEGNYYVYSDDYEPIGENITLTTGNYEISFSGSINTTITSIYYFSILKNGINTPLCNRLVSGTGETIIIVMDCNVSINNTQNISLGVKII